MAWLRRYSRCLATAMSTPLMSSITPPMPSSESSGGVIELISGVLIAVGFVTGAAAFIASGMMAAAYFMAHFPAGFWPIQNDGELSVLYCFLFLYMAMRGSGIWSVEAVRVGETA